MAPRMTILRQLFWLTLGIGVTIVAVVVAGLTLGGMMSPVWLARGILVSALVVGALEVVIVQRAWRVREVYGPLKSWRLTDRTQGCSVALLGALIALGLLACGGIMEWLVEWSR